MKKVKGFFGKCSKRSAKGEAVDKVDLTVVPPVKGKTKKTGSSLQNTALGASKNRGRVVHQLWK